MPIESIVMLAISGLVAVATLVRPRVLRASGRGGVPRGPAAPIGELRPGTWAKIEGVVEHERILRAPVSGRSCVAYRVRVVAVMGDNVRGAGLFGRTVHEEAEVVPFIVSDAGGRALVRADHRTDDVLEIDRALSSSMLIDAPAEMRAFLDARGVAATARLYGSVRRNRELRCYEGVIEPGERVTVYGHVGLEPDPAPPPGAVVGYREAPQRLVLAGHGREPLRVRDERRPAPH